MTYFIGVTVCPPYFPGQVLWWHKTNSKTLLSAQFAATKAFCSGLEFTHRSIMVSLAPTKQTHAKIFPNNTNELSVSVVSWGQNEQGISRRKSSDFIIVAEKRNGKWLYYDFDFRRSTQHYDRR